MDEIILRRWFLLFALTIGIVHSAELPSGGYDALIQQGKSQLQAGSAEQAAASGNAAIKMSRERWEGYALVGGALMNLKRYEAAADTLSEAIKRAPESKQPALRELRRQCLLAESGSPKAASPPVPATTTTQAEIVLWKSIEKRANLADFQSYLDQYPQGAFEVLARRHLTDAQAEADRAAAELAAPRWIAMAMDNENHSYYIFRDARTRAEATSRVLEACENAVKSRWQGSPPCRIIIPATSKCVAIAQKDGLINRTWGWSYGYSKADAEQNALAGCKHSGCKVRESQCSAG